MDVPKRTVTVCALTPQSKELRTLPTMMANLLELGAWLRSVGRTHAAMESTAGVFLLAANPSLIPSP